MVAYIGSVLIDVCMSHCSEVESTSEHCDTHTSARTLPYVQPHHHRFNHTLMNHN